MVHSRSTWLYSLSFVFSTWASTFQTTLPTASPRDSLLAEIPEPTPGPGAEFRGLEPRADSATGAEVSVTNSAGGIVLTSSVPASVCGFVNGVYSPSKSLPSRVGHKETHDSIVSSIECVSDGQCVFHTSGSRYSNMVGCCYDSNPVNCRFETACHDASKVRATPSLTLILDINFNILCTRDSSSACVTWTYPELDITDYGCGPTATLEEIYLTASRTQLEYRSVTGYFYSTTIATVDLITVNDAFIHNYESGVRSAGSITETGAPRASTSGLSGTSTATGASSHSSGDGSRGSSNSSNIGAIAGGVVGGVVGLGAIIGAIWACIWYSKKKKQNLEGTSLSAPVQPPMHPMPPALAEVEGTPGKPVQRYSAVGGPDDPPAYTPELPVSDSYIKPHEMDSHNFVAELSAGRAEIPTEQQYQGAGLDRHTDQNRPIGQQYYGR